MTETLFNTHIPIVVIIVFIIGLFFVYMEVCANAKGILAIIGGLCAIVDIVLCGITGVPTIEIVFLLMIFAIILMSVLNIAENKNSLLDYDKTMQKNADNQINNPGSSQSNLFFEETATISEKDKILKIPQQQSTDGIKSEAKNVI